MNRYPLLITFAFLALSWPISLLLPVETRDLAAINILGYLLFATGIALILSAAGLFKRIGTTIDPTKAPDRLVTTGIYSLSRNPMYLGMLLTLIAAQLILASPIGLLFPVSFFLFMNGILIPREEKMVAEVFGASYADYRLQTRRWL